MARKKKRSSGPTWLAKRQCWYWAPTINGKRRHYYGTDRKDVMNRALLDKADALQGRLPDDQSYTVKRLMSEWLAHKKPLVAPSTYAAYDRYNRIYIEPELGGIRSRHLKPATVQAFYDRLPRHPKHPKPQTIRFIHGVLNSAFQYAVSLDILSRNPATHTRRPKVETFQAHPLSLENLQAFIEVNGDAWLFPAALLAFLMGLRRGEVLGLQWRDVDFEQGIVHVRRSLDWRKENPDRKGTLTLSTLKTASSYRSLPLPALCRQALSKHRATVAKKCLAVGHALEPTDFVFSYVDTGRPISPKSLTMAYKAMLDAAGLPRIRLHDARHTTATLLIKLGEPLLAVQKLMGHKTLAITADIYTHVTALDQRTSLSRLNEAIAER